jgi:hypothetical protein
MSYPSKMNAILPQTFIHGIQELHLNYLNSDRICNFQKLLHFGS